MLWDLAAHSSLGPEGHQGVHASPTALNQRQITRRHRSTPPVGSRRASSHSTALLRISHRLESLAGPRRATALLVCLGRLESALFLAHSASLVAHALRSEGAAAQSHTARHKH